MRAHFTDHVKQLEFRLARFRADDRRASGSQRRWTTSDSEIVAVYGALPKHSSGTIRCVYSFDIVDKDWMISVVCTVATNAAQYEVVNDQEPVQ